MEARTKLNERRRVFFEVNLSRIDKMLDDAFDDSDYELLEKYGEIIREARQKMENVAI